MAREAQEVKPEKKKELAQKRPDERPLGCPAKVVEIIRRTGATGEITQIRCEVMEGRGQGAKCSGAMSRVP